VFTGDDISLSTQINLPPVIVLFIVSYYCFIILANKFSLSHAFKILPASRMHALIGA